MSTPLDPMRHLQGLGAVGGGGPVDPATAGKVKSDGVAPTDTEGRTFADSLQAFVDQADHAQKEFDQAIEAVERGDTDNLHQVMIAQNQAQLSLRLAAEVRNKLVEAYKEVMRTQF